MANYKPDNNPLVKAAAKQFGNISGENLHENYASRIGPPPANENPLDDPIYQDKMKKAVEAHKKAKMFAMNGDMPQSLGSWLDQAYMNLLRGYEQHVKGYDKMMDQVNHLTSNEIAGPKVDADFLQRKIQTEQGVGIGSDYKNPGRGIPPRPPGPPNPQDGPKGGPNV